MQKNRDAKTRNNTAYLLTHLCLCANTTLYIYIYRVCIGLEIYNGFRFQKIATASVVAAAAAASSILL